MTKKNYEIRQQIKKLVDERADVEHKIDKIAKEIIRDFHFLDHEVSYFWECEKSPIGMCVWDISKCGFHIDCHCYYCKQPVERK